MKFKIRTRERMCASPGDGLSQAWPEVQVVQGRKIVHRCGTEREAGEWIARQPVEYCKPSNCLNIQWGKLHLRDGVPACPSCGEPAEMVVAFFGVPGWAHASTQEEPS